MCGAMPRFKEHLLIVEDNREMRDLLRKVLEKEGYRVSLAGDGCEAAALLARGTLAAAAAGFGGSRPAAARTGSES